MVGNYSVIYRVISSYQSCLRSSVNHSMQAYQWLSHKWLTVIAHHIDTQWECAFVLGLVERCCCLIVWFDSILQIHSSAFVGKKWPFTDCSVWKAGPREFTTPNWPAQVSAHAGWRHGNLWSLRTSGGSSERRSVPHGCTVALCLGFREMLNLS